MITQRISRHMKKWWLWLTWLIAMTALYAAISARATNARADAEREACESVIYWESPLLK
ncbi:MAG: hypothetical protein KatS3mg017_0254 [Fimbriimonadales bacterium]|nr:MAG: hypothetical protein KatS3mg017_0254 [Fimbriimonadales bacterium]GIV09038.1 MAG: hypothetical protein KatS3mg019_1129 [Fimbriimonadales bacterium]